MDRIELADRLISVLFPQRCLFCGEVVAYDDFWCGTCAKKNGTPVLKCGRVDCDFPHSFADALAATEYSGCTRGLIWRVKDKADRRVLRFFANEMLAVMSEYWSGAAFDVITPVPTTALKMKERGFNPAERLARYVSVRAGIPLCTDALVRLEGSKPQRGLTAAERRENARKSYAPEKSGKVTGKRVLLVDDVFTTGSTADACSRKLTEAGAESIYVIAASFTNQDSSLQTACNHSATMI